VAPDSVIASASKLGLFEATMIVMGGVVGSGIFINPHVVAQHVHSSAQILGVWVAGGVVALIGAFIYAELAARLPKAGGEYVYLREGIHPAAGFLYGWIALIVINAGGCAAVAVTFARYLQELIPVGVPERAIAITTMVVLAAVNCIGVRLGSAVQSALMMLRIAAIVTLVVCGVWGLPGVPGATGVGPITASSGPTSLDLAAAFGAAMIPVFFAYGGWQTANFVAAEVREPRRNLPRALIIGMAGVITLYVAVNVICVKVLGPAGLAAAPAPASAVMERVAGRRGGSCSRWESRSRLWASSASQY
jgi:APA family basic amino acid/polyamine antiporter